MSRKRKAPSGVSRMSPKVSGANNLRYGIMRVPLVSPISEPTRTEVQGPSGRVFSSYPYSEPLFTSRPNVVILPNWTLDIGAGASGAFDNLAAPTIPAIAGLISVITNSFQRLVNRVNPTRVVVSNSLVTASDMGTYLQNYSYAFLGARGLQGILAAAGLNNNMQSIGGAIEPFRFRLEACLRRLEGITIPPMLVSILDQLCGAYVGEPGAPIFLQYLDGTAGPPVDLTSQTNIATILGSIETLLGNFGAMTQDTASVFSLFGQAYGYPRSFPDKDIHTELALYEMIRTTAYTWDNTSAVKLFTLPRNYFNAGTIPEIPLLIRREIPMSDLTRKMYTSLFRPQVAGIGQPAAAGASEYIGLFNVNNASFRVIYYGANGGSTTANGSGAGTLGFPDATSFLFPWAWDAQQDAAVSGNIVNPYVGYDMVYTTVDALADETEALWEEMLFSGLVV